MYQKTVSCNDTGHTCPWMTDAGPVSEVGGCNNNLDVATPSPSHKGDARDVAAPSDQLETVLVRGDIIVDKI
jgi:hypothetical protein